MIENKQKILFTDLFRDFGDILGQIGQIEKIASVIKKKFKILTSTKTLLLFTQCFKKKNFR